MKSVWVRIISCITAILLSVTLFATAPTAFENAKQQLMNMLDGKDSLSYEKSIFIIENAYYNNQLIYADFTENLDFNTALIKELANTQKTVPAYKADYFYQYARQTPEQYEQDYKKAVLNWAIFTYLTDTTLYKLDSSHALLKLPYTYPTTDPMGTDDWTNTQVLNVLNNGKGNCFALASLFKIFADRLNSNASLCIAPNHIYIRHEDDKGTRYNIELASGSFPGSGTMQTLTYSTDDAIKNNIALRTLTSKQAVALCLVYLAKGYEYKTGIKSDAFMLQCAEIALKYDTLNLNAMLLQAELLEHTLQQKDKTIAQLQTDVTFKQYEKLLAKLYRFGYREMPIDMKNLLVNGWTKDTTQLYLKNNLVQNQNETRKASLSWGLFDEEHKHKPTEQYGNTLFDCKTKKIKGFSSNKPIYNDYNFDPVVFAWNIDPLAYKFPGQSPYSAFGNNPIYNIDVDGAYQYPADKAASYKKAYPTLTKYLQLNVKNDVMKSSSIMAGFLKYSGGNLTEQQVANATTWNSGPTVKIVEKPNGWSVNGWFDSENNSIEISTALAKQLENSSVEDKQAALYSLYVTLTHETVHYGDYLDGHRQESTDKSRFGGEPGKAFMDNVFYSKNVQSEGQTVRTMDVGLDHTNINDAKKMMQMNIDDSNESVIPTVPDISKGTNTQQNTTPTNIKPKGQ